ncbi:hypothetical protein HDU99_006967, partial [Rhizoclosmatium hyalinum]
MTVKPHPSKQQRLRQRPRQKPAYSYTKTCGHLCSLTASIPSCCFCADGRPQQLTYEHYVDGSGLQLDAMRSADYCV